MNFMKIIESLDEALYTAMSWLVFYPLTLWRTIVQPQQMMDYAGEEVSDRAEDQYDDAIRPPLFLFLTLVISHGIEVMTAPRNPLLADNHGLAAYVDGDLALIGLRMLIFSIFPLMMTVRLLRRQRKRLNHANLRRPFYAQCYTAAPFALLIGIGTLESTKAFAGAHELATVTIGVGVLWYLLTQARWFARKLHVSVLAGTGDAVIAASAGAAISILAAVLIR